MACLLCTLWCGGRWVEMRVLQGVRGVVGLCTWDTRGGSCGVVWVHGVWDAGAGGRRLAGGAVWRGWLCGCENR